MPPLPTERRSLVEVPWLAAALLLTLVALWPSEGREFVYDDRILVEQNPTIRSLEGLTKAWDAAYWDFLGSDEAAQLGYWRPLTAVALFAGWQLGGGEPWAFHGLSLALHLVAVAAAFHLARRLSGSVAVGFFAATLFGLHPVQVEPVAWISSINDPLYGAFVLLGLGAFLAWRERGSPGVPLAAGALFAGGLLAKENAVAFLPLALALDLGRRPGAPEPGTSRLAGLRPLLRAHGVFLGVAFAYFLARVAVFGDLGAGVDRVTTELLLPEGRGLTLRVELLGGFLGLLAWPAELSLFREPRVILPGLDATALAAYGAVAAWLAATLWALQRRARPLLAGLLIPVAGVLPALVRLESLGRFVLSDRFLYVAVFGAALTAALLAASRLPRWLSFGVLGLVAVLAGTQSRARERDWRDEESLFRATVSTSPESVYARWGLGRVLIDRFQTSGDAALLDEARASFEHVQDLIDPRDGSPPDPALFYTLEDALQANVGIGWCFLFAALLQPEEYGLDEAELVFNATLQRFPRSHEALVGLGVTRLHMDRLEEAEASMREAADLQPRFQPAWFNLGLVATRRGQFAAAAEHFERALEILPNDPLTDLRLGMALAQGGLDLERAREVLARAAEAMPHDPEPRIQLATLEATAQRWREALGWIDGALSIEVEHGPAHVLRGKLLVQLDDVDGAVAAFGRACLLMPDELEPHLLLGGILSNRGFGDAALPYLRRAVELDPTGPYAAELRAAIEAIENADD